MVRNALRNPFPSSPSAPQLKAACMCSSRCFLLNKAANRQSRPCDPDAAPLLFPSLPRPVPLLPILSVHGPVGQRFGPFCSSRDPLLGPVAHL